MYLHRISWHFGAELVRCMGIDYSGNGVHHDRLVVRTPRNERRNHLGATKKRIPLPVFRRGDVLCHGLFQKLHGHCFGFLFRYLPVSGDDLTVFRNRYRVAVFILRPVGACGNITTDAAQSAGDSLRRDAAREGMAALAPVFCMIIRP